MDPHPTTDDQPVAPEGGLAGWFAENWKKLAVVVALAVVVSKYLHPIDLVLAVGGLSLIIFLHELGHFVAAKLCDVHVKTFSIGFGPALPFCQFKYGETTYKLAMIPLGGFVAMVGEGDEDGDVVEGASDPEEAASDPRSFKNKPVFQRMFIISAGVIMNLILGCVCFMVTYLHGVQERPAIATWVEPGSAAWRAGIHSGTEITRINGRQNPWFNDLQPIVASTRAGRTVDLVLRYGGTTRQLDIEPTRTEGALLPLLGISSPSRMTLPPARREGQPPVRPDSPAAGAVGADGVGFKAGDKIVAMTDPDQPDKVTPLAADPAAGLTTPYFDYERRLQRLAANPATAGKPIALHVERADGPADPVTVTVKPAHRWTTGLRMRMGEIVAVRVNSPAAAAGVQDQQTIEEAVTRRGDRIVKVELPTKDGPVVLERDKLDPLRLPFELVRWAEQQPKGWDPKANPIQVEVLRDGKGHTEERVTLPLAWDPSFQYDLSRPSSPGAPVPVPGLGLAYHVQAVVDGVEPGSPAEKLGLAANDQIKEVRYKVVGPDGKEMTQKWETVEPHQWAFVDVALQTVPPHEMQVKYERGGVVTTVSLAAAADASWPVADLGLDLSNDTQTQQAHGVLDALEMGAYRTTRSIRTIYQQLYALAAGRISVKMMSGPISLARMSYVLAGEDVWHLILFMGLISVNLAVVNFLPIPVLDGGHMMFLLYEGLRGRPAPEWAHVGLTYAGLAVVGCLMLFVLGLDIWRIFFA